MNKNPIKSLVRIHEMLNQCGGVYFENTLITEGGISLLLVNGLTEIDADNYGALTHAAANISEYLGQGNAGFILPR